MAEIECECGAKYRFPDSAIGKRAKCKNCGAIITLKPPEDEGTIPITDDSPFMDEMASAAERAEAASDEPPLVSPAYFPSPDSAGRLGKVIIEEPETPPSYLKSLTDTFLFLTSVQNVIAFLFIWLIVALGEILLPAAGCIGLIGQIIIAGWFCAFRFLVIASAAAGERELPTLTLTGGPMDDIVIPLLKWLASWVIVLAPAFICLWITVYLGLQTAGNPVRTAVGGGIAGILQDIAPEFVAFVALVCAGVFIWPLLALCITLGGFSTFGRPDLIVTTLVRTVGPYVLTVALVVGADFLGWLVSTSLAGDAGIFGGNFVVRFVAVGVAVYFEIIALRVIGLYYYHFKDRFAWAWD